MPIKKFTGYRVQGTVIVFLLFLFTVTSNLSPIYARYTPNDAYQEKRAAFESTLSKLSSVSKEKVLKADEILYEINDKVCFRFEEDINHLAAIMVEVKNREGVTETRVAFGGVETKIETADYWVNYAAEALAYQKSQNYTPIITSESQINSSISSSKNNLENDLGVLKNKILRAKTEVGKAIK